MARWARDIIVLLQRAQTHPSQMSRGAICPRGRRLENKRIAPSYHGARALLSTKSFHAAPVGPSASVA
jgi:hypothetical protein